MTYRRLLTDAQVAWVRAIQSKQRQLKRALKRAETAAAREEALRQLHLLPTVDDQAAALGVNKITVIRIRRGKAYLTPEPVSVPRGTPNNHREVSCHG